MSSSTYKGSLTVGGTALEKSKLQLRRPTPDSDVLASSDDDREHVAPVVRPTPGGFAGGRRPSSGWLQDIQPANRKFSLPSVSFAGSMPTTPSLELPQQTRPSTSAFPWNTSSFTSTQSNSRLKEVLPSPTSAHAPHDNPLPSPVPIDSDNPIGFLLSQQSSNPLRKAVRSQSYSIGQGDVEHNPIAQFSAARHAVRPSANLRHRPSKPSLLGESSLGLSQLREDEADEVESSNGSEHGVRLPAGYWEREQKQALLKQAAMENARARNRATSTGSPVSHQQQQRRKTTAGLRNVSYGNPADYAIEELEDPEPSMNHPTLSLTRRFSEHVSVLGRESEADAVDTPQKQQWATGNIQAHLADGMARRHSFAHYGSSYNSTMPTSTLSNTQEEDEELASPRQDSQTPEEDNEPFDAAAYFTGYGPASRAINSSAISAAHPDPIVPNPAMSAANPYAVPHVLGRPGRRLFVVTFKCSRADIYYLYDNTGLEIRRGDLVIVEGDRGCDLGQVTHADVSLEDAKKFKAEANEEHFRWLVMFSQYSLAGTSNDNGMLGALARANGTPNPMSTRPQLTGMGAQQDQDAKPKMIKRLAQQHEIAALRDKEGQEAKAKRLGAQKAADHKLPMEILDAEYQADYHKLTYFYYAESYVNFNDLVTDLFKQYKVRIWMSAVNPASVVNPAGMSQIPPPSAIGPGAVLNSSAANASLAVGPGFGSNNYRSNEQYGRGRGNAGYSNFEEPYGAAFSHQIPHYPAAQAPFMHPWASGQQYTQAMYDRYNPYAIQAGGYPNATASASPMNYGAYYPPTSFAPSPVGNMSSSSGGARGGFQGAPAYGPPQHGGASNARVVHGLNTNVGVNSNTNLGANTGQDNGRPAAAGNNAYNANYDPAFLTAAMQNISFGSK